MTPIKLYSKPRYKGTKVLDGEQYTLRFRWSVVTKKWYLYIKGVSNEVDIKRIALLCGRELLSHYGYENILGELWLIDNSGKDEDPVFDGMGTRWTLEYTPKTS